MNLTSKLTDLSAPDIDNLDKKLQEQQVTPETQHIGVKEKEISAEDNTKA